MSDDRYWTVTMSVFAFDTEEEAAEYAERLGEVFREMPESAEYGSVVRVEEETA